MPVDAARRKLLYKIAMAYYQDNLTQEQVARRFGLSRLKVWRLLDQARSARIVQVSIIPPHDTKPVLERSIEAKYGLDEVVLVSPSSDAPAALVRDLGQAAADYLAHRLQGREVVGMSWGTTLRAVVDALPAHNWPDLRVVQINGGLGRPESETHGADLTRRMAAAFNTHPVTLSAPGIVTSKLVRDALLTDPQIFETLALAARADVVLVGIGVPRPEAVLMQVGALLSTEEIDRLRSKAAVGDIALRFFDADGQTIDDEVNDRILGLDLQQRRELPRVIGVAGGAHKVEAIRAAVRGHLIDVLITDDATATILQEDR